MFRGNAISDLVEVFKRRQIALYHSCQLADFRSYIQIGGVPSRKLLTDCGCRFTAFETDRNDRENGVWDKVFLNPLDFGEIFAFGHWGIPTVYGPIAFVVLAEALITAEDVAICLRSAGTEGFHREEEALRSVQEANRLFVYDENQGFPLSAKIKWRPELCKEFDTDYASNPEISCSYPEGKLPLRFTSYLLVDPYIFGGKPLARIVADWLASHQVKIEVKERECHQERRAMYNDLVAILTDSFLNLEQIVQLNYISSDLRVWARQLISRNLGEQWSRFAHYLLEGTLKCISSKE